MGGPGAVISMRPSRRGFLAGAAGAGLAAPASARASARLPLAANQQLTAALQQAPSLTPWFAGLADRLSARCNIVCVGDSITEGQHAAGPPSTGFENRWLARLRHA